MATRGFTGLTFQPWQPHAAGPEHRSLWLHEAFDDKTEPARVLQGARRAHVGIIGGGFTGLWTAIRLRELDPTVSVAVVEADLCGTGASGRCSGGIGTWWGKLPTLIKMLGKEDALRVLHASVRGVEDIEAIVAERRLPCDWRRGRSVWSATAPAQVGAWEAAFRAADEVGLAPPWRRLSTEELGEMFGQKGPYLAGVIDERASRVQPALFARGLRQVAMALGVEIFERSPVTRIAPGTGGLEIQTAAGTMTADKIVMAANAWMAHLTEFRPSVMVVSSEIVATDPIPELLEHLGLRRRPGGFNSRLMVNYGGITPKGQVYLGRGGGTIAFAGRMRPAFDWSPKQAREVERDFRFLYPELRDVPITRSWAGPIDRSTTGLPWFSTLSSSDRIHYAIGYSGHGVGASALGGRILASSVLGRRDEWAALAECFERARSGRFPPEPLRFLGGHVVRAGVARKEIAEREGRRPSRLDVALARLAPATMSDYRKKPS